jgi:oligopeptide/dipeptide ABC transporter ATP-binding protein
MVLAVRDLTVRAGGREVVDGVSLRVGEGESVGIVGESGSGKSLTARAVLDLLPPGVGRTGGSVVFRDRELTGLAEPALRRLRGPEIGYVPQDPLASLDPLLTVGEQLTEVLRVHRPGRRGPASDAVEILAGFGIRRRRGRMFAQAAELLEQVGIDRPRERARQYPGDFSGGMRQRAVIAAAIALKPALMVADEPTTALDATVERGVLDLLRRLREDIGMALLLVSHDLDVIAWTCERAYVFYRGQVMETGPVGALIEAPRHPYTAALIESSGLLKAGETRQRTTARERVAEPGAGCPFAPRCPRALPVCADVRPGAAGAGPDHEFWCHNPRPVHGGGPDA